MSLINDVQRVIDNSSDEPSVAIGNFLSTRIDFGINPELQEPWLNGGEADTINPIFESNRISPIYNFNYSSSEIYDKSSIPNGEKVSIKIEKKPLYREDLNSNFQKITIDVFILINIFHSFISNL